MYFSCKIALAMSSNGQHNTMRVVCCLQLPHAPDYDFYLIYCFGLAFGAPTQCPNQGPPIFGSASIRGSLGIQGAENNLDAISVSLASLLNIDRSVIVLQNSETGRRESQTVFEIFLDDSQMQSLSKVMQSPDLASSLASELGKRNVSASVTLLISSVEEPKKRVGEVWELRGSDYVLVACPRGFLLINTTAETQECKECETGTFTMSFDYDCGPDRCDSRACVPCPDGAVCHKGSSDPWMHFIPKALELGGVVIEWVTLIKSGEKTRLFCRQESMSCGPATSLLDQEMDVHDDYVWEFDEDQAIYVLKSCPAGHQLVNTAGGTFNAQIQKCEACGALKCML